MKKNIAIILIVLICAAGSIWYFFFMEKTPTKKITNDTTPTSSQETPSSYTPPTEGIEIPAIEETTAPPIITSDNQTIQDGTLTLRGVQTPVDSWIVAYNDDMGKPGRIVGYTHVMAGTAQQVSLPVNASLVTDTVYLVVHKDAGIPQTFEFPGPDVALAVNGVVVTKTVRVE